ncbi:MAG TPA: hypothetical protein VK524_34380 [Polyangiaceae bacterium]|nr:hypothetical protein [Polyangiaceae bacterium]
MTRSPLPPFIHCRQQRILVVDDSTSNVLFTKHEGAWSPERVEREVSRQAR